MNIETLGDLLNGSRGSATLVVDRGEPLAVDGFRAEVARIAGGLAALGVKPADRIAIWLPNVPAWLATLFALAHLGAVVVSVNTRFKSHELATLLRRSRPSGLLYWPGFSGIDFAGMLAACDPAALDSLEFIVEYAEAPRGEHRHPAGARGVARFDFNALPAANEAVHQAAVPSSPAILFSTSGTTKEPKLVLHDQATLVRHARNVASAWQLGPGSAVYLVPPFCGVYGFCTALAAFAGNAPLWMRPGWDAGEASGDILRGGCTHITGTDDVYAQLLAARDDPTPYPSVIYAGFAPFNPALADIVELAERRGLRLSGLYGSSEVQALFSIRAGADPADARGPPGGYPVDPDARVRARDPETNRVLSAGEVGELEILAPHSRMVGYFGDEAATAAAFTEDGWFRTGDLGSVTGDGGFLYLSRAGDSLRLGGFLVSPAEIESVIQEAQGIAACQVVAIPRPEGMRAVAFVIESEGGRIDENQLARHVRSRLASYKVPVRFLAIDAFPVTVSANATKIRRDLLRQLATERLDAAAVVHPSRS